jgi:hypothetical protein
VLPSVREGGRTPLGCLAPEVQVWSGRQIGHLMLTQEQAHLRLSADTPPLASPVTGTPQLEVASFGLH